ncbi:MAG: hypothetical protein OEM52_07420 [bacterium]|nr:hypothetical protein [bacterium]
MTPLSELTAKLRLDFHDTLSDPAHDLSDEQLCRSIERGLLFLNRDFAVTYTVTGDAVYPVLTMEHREMLLLRSLALVCETMAARSSRQVSFSSGDKSVTHGDEARIWLALGERSMARYDAAVEAWTGGSGGVTPLLYGNE